MKYRNSYRENMKWKWRKLICEEMKMSVWNSESLYQYEEEEASILHPLMQCNQAGLSIERNEKCWEKSKRKGLHALFQYS